MESRSSPHFLWKGTINDGALPIRRFGDGPTEQESKAMKKAPSLSKSDLLEQGLIKKVKKINKLDFVDEATKRRFRDGSTVYCHSLKCYVQLKSFDAAT